MSWSVGTRHEVHHDQAGYRLGFFEVIGLVDTSEDGPISIGEIPTRKIPHWVFK